MLAEGDEEEPRRDQTCSADALAAVVQEKVSEKVVLLKKLAVHPERNFERWPLAAHESRISPDTSNR